MVHFTDFRLRLLWLATIRKEAFLFNKLQRSERLPFLAYKPRFAQNFLHSQVRMFATDCICSERMSFFVYNYTFWSCFAMRDKRSKFVMLAEKRVTRLLRDVRLIGNLGNKSNYEYTDDDVRKIFAAIDNEVRSARKRFDGRGEPEERAFRLA